MEAAEAGDWKVRPVPSTVRLPALLKLMVSRVSPALVMVLPLVMPAPKLATCPAPLGCAAGAPTSLFHLVSSAMVPPLASFQVYWRFPLGVTPAQVLSTRSSSY